MGSEGFLPHLKFGDVLLDTRIRTLRENGGITGFQTDVFVLDRGGAVRHIGPVEGWHNFGSILEAVNYGSEIALNIVALTHQVGRDEPISGDVRHMATSSDIRIDAAIEALQKCVLAINEFREENSWRFVDRIR